MAEQVDTTKGCQKIDCFTFKGHDRVLHNGWSYAVGPKAEMRLFWIAYVLTLSDFLYLLLLQNSLYIYYYLKRELLKLI